LVRVKEEIKSSFENKFSDKFAKTVRLDNIHFMMVNDEDNAMLTSRFTKEVINALPLFYLSFFKAPNTICKLIRKIQIQFLWSWGHNDRKIAWVAWDKVCSPIKAGGLGVRDIHKFNVALFRKWRFGVGKEGVWKDILESRYGNWKDMKIVGRNRKQSNWWKDLCKICDVGNQLNWFDNNIKWVLGNGKKIQLWEDNWIGVNHLKIGYPGCIL